MQNKNKNVYFISVSTEPSDTVKQFVKGNEMA